MANTPDAGALSADFCSALIQTFTRGLQTSVRMNLNASLTNGLSRPSSSVPKAIPEALVSFSPSAPVACCKAGALNLFCLDIVGRKIYQQLLARSIDSDGSGIIDEPLGTSFRVQVSQALSMKRYTMQPSRSHISSAVLPILNASSVWAMPVTVSLIVNLTRQPPRQMNLFQGRVAGILQRLICLSPSDEASSAARASSGPYATLPSYYSETSSSCRVPDGGAVSVLHAIPKEALANTWVLRSLPSQGGAGASQAQEYRGFSHGSYASISANSALSAVVAAPFYRRQSKATKKYGTDELVG
ncbi:hypothetical protein BC835DRAFT_1306782 [Cytidiella melzeri]|nr:hypothetical protein BC835DRAFT_1306782 [Cytidiella melzeri]